MANKITPTIHQQRAFALKQAHPEKSWKEIMLSAGYKEETASRPTQNLTASPGWGVLINDYRNELAKNGIDKAKIASKMKEFIDWKDSNGNPNGELQLKAVTTLREDLGLIEKKDNTTNNVTNNTVIINNMSDEELNNKLNTLLEDINRLKEDI